MGNIVRLRNKRTGEVRDFDDASEDFRDAKAESGPTGNIVWTSYWEQTGDHHVEALAKRAEAGAVRDEDLGHDVHPIRLETEASAEADPAPWLALTPAEVEAGLTPELKAQHLAEQQEGSVVRSDALTVQKAKQELANSVGSGSGSGNGSDDGPTKEQLKEQARELGVSTAGTKAEIQDRIDAANGSGDDAGDEESEGAVA